MTRPRTGWAVGVALAAALVYAVLCVGYCRHWGWPQRLDWSLLNPAHGIGVKHPAWVSLWDGVSVALGPVPLRLLGMAATVAALVRRDVRAALVLFACAELNGLVTWAAKGLVDRPRPPTMLVAVPSWSFPSGHALEATSALLALLAFLLPVLSRALGRVAIAVTALCLLLVGIARVALNVHYPTDVLAGWALGYLYFLFCLAMFRPFPRALADPAPVITTQLRNRV
ncbi:phosphatase PAP2 family protein [Mycobacterium sp. E3198]|uniref:phosphatase PAP2 family protein n=1 Tax=Mycobacterium sp. E3198 TaxID=1834143 RepID=UPI0008014F37|nr:phosphatase PAP2 family protein [Mycobacterium sp. E3198]OBG37700.1 hypothetical protein A5673_16045 [Mycobacterium sp. E3198]